MDKCLRHPSTEPFNLFPSRLDDRALGDELIQHGEVFGTKGRIGPTQKHPFPAAVQMLKVVSDSSIGQGRCCGELSRGGVEASQPACRQPAVILVLG